MSLQNYYEILGLDKTAGAEEIKKAYARKIREFPNQTHPEQFQSIREAYEVLKDEKRRAEYDRFHEDGGTYAELLGYAMEEMEEEDYEAASEFLEEMLNRYPDDPVAKNKLSECYFLLEQYEKSKKLMADLILEEPSDLAYNFQMALIYERLGDYDKAVQQMKKLIRLKPDESNYYLKLSYMYFEQEDYESAIAILEKKLKQQKETVPDLPLLSELYFLTYYQDTGVYRRQILNRIKSLPTNEQEKETLIEMLMGICSRLKDDLKTHHIGQVIQP